MMCRRCTVKSAITALLIAHAELAARAQVPPTPIRLVDVQGQPVAGALVGSYLHYDREREPAFTPLEGSLIRTDERGEVSLPVWYETGIYAIRDDPQRPLVGVTRITRAVLGKPARIVMHPPCRVRLRVECPGFGELEEKYHAELDGPTWERRAVVQWDAGDRIAHTLATSSRTGELEVLLPPGHYTIRVVGNEIQPESRTVEVGPGHRVRSLGLIELSPSANVKQGIFADFWRWNPSILQDRLGGEDSGPKVIYRRREWGPAPRDVGGIQHLAFSPDGKLLATSHGYKDRPGEVKLWDARTGTLLAALTGPEGEDGVHELAFAPDGATLAGSVASMHNFELPSTVILWNVADRRLLRRLHGHSATITALAFAPDGKTLATGAGDGTVRFWDPASGRETGRFAVDTEWPRAIAYAPDGRSLAVAYAEALRVWDIQGARFRAPLEPGGFWVHSLAFAPDGRTLAASGMVFPLNNGGRDGQVRLYDVTSRPPLRRATLRRDPGEPPWALAGKDSFGDVLFTPDGRRVISDMVGTIVMWDARTGVELAALVRNNGVSSDDLDLSPDGRWLAVGGKHGSYSSLIAIPSPPAP
jgi:WD40 repeat protein